MNVAYCMTVSVLNDNPLYPQEEFTRIWRFSVGKTRKIFISLRTAAVEVASLIGLLASISKFSHNKKNTKQDLDSAVAAVKKGFREKEEGKKNFSLMELRWKLISFEQRQIITIIILYASAWRKRKTNNCKTWGILPSLPAFVIPDD